MPSNYLIGKDVYHWPEFKALALKLGIPWTIATTEITIQLGIDDPPKITHVYQSRVAPNQYITELVKMSEETEGVESDGSC